MNRSFIATVLIVLGTLFSSGAYADLQGRLPATPGGTDYQAVYDTDRDITWLANGNAGAGSVFDDGVSTTDGLMTWNSPMGLKRVMRRMRSPGTLMDDNTIAG
jgi:hypothetical protein